LNIVFFSIIIITGVPFKILKIFYFFLKSENSIKDSLIILTILNYEEMKNLKLEFINGNLYLNCSTRTSIYRVIFKNNQGISQIDAFKIFKELQIAQNKFNILDRKLTKKAFFKLGSLTTEEGVKISKQH
jgi:hypothetical protein